jgi:hypothetical protein
MNIGFLLAAIGMTVIVYVLPGYLALSLVRIPTWGFQKKVLAALPVSIILVPFLVVATSALFRLRPSLLVWFLFCAGLAILNLALRLFRKNPTLQVISRFSSSRVSSLEWTLTSLLIASLGALFLIPRIDALVHGASALVIGPWDVHWQLQELVSVARTGLPPMHYFFPDIPLVYYYWSLIFPAILVNQPFLSLSMTQALAFHSLVQSIACMASTYAFLQLNYSRWISRIIGFLFLTIASGFDFFVTSSSDILENWQRSVSWLFSRNEIVGVEDRYLSSPQHLAGFLACVLALFVWRNLRVPLWLRLTLLGMLGSFTLGSSPEIFLSFAFGAALWIFLYRTPLVHWLRAHLSSPRAIRLFIFRTRWQWMGVLIIVAGLTLSVWQQLALTSGSTTHLIWNSFRITLAERFLGAESYSLGVLDRILTILGLPVVGTWILLVEIGLPVLWFGYWLVRNANALYSRWWQFLAIFPIAIFTLTFLIGDSAQANNFPRNAAGPAQLVLVLGALLAIEHAPWKMYRRWPRILAVYSLSIAITAQLISPFITILLNSRSALGSVLSVTKMVSIANIPIAQPPLNWPDSMRYIPWANVSTPGSALFIEETPIQDDIHFRQLERLRLLDPAHADSMEYYSQDAELFNPSNLASLPPRIQSQSLLDWARRSKFVQTNHPSLYYVSRSGEKTGMGAPVYRDAYVIVYQADSGG